MCIDDTAGRTSQPGEPGYEREVSWLEDVVRALDMVGGFKTSMRQLYGDGAPFLDVVGDGGARLKETVHVRWVGQSLRGVWSWGEDIAGDGDPQVAAEAIGRVVSPRM
ncbi:hypothetical protein [Actinomadura terrae]|uniref:hypothetical protein n=1 Tax=Actinomadura terrae TaxID=604353 RepID=UPI001FA7C49E|nr:hypothetical protein [Actinomadura terrae]